MAPTSTPNWPGLAALPRPCDFKSEDQLPPSEVVGGLYMLLDLSGVILYVGQSCDIRRRLDEHRGIHEWPAWARSYDTKVKDFHRAVWWPVASSSERLRLEGILILAETPSLNRALSLFVRPASVTQAGIQAGTRRPAKNASRSALKGLVGGPDRSLAEGGRRNRTRSRRVHTDTPRDSDR